MRKGVAQARRRMAAAICRLQPDKGSRAPGCFLSYLQNRVESEEAQKQRLVTRVYLPKGGHSANFVMRSRWRGGLARGTGVPAR
jgi:hypothetical protein